MAKELRFFYTPNVDSGELPQDEAQHAVRVLRMGSGDELNLMDGKGNFYHAEITTATGHRCYYNIINKVEQKRAWSGRIHLAMAPTKLNDRTEWFVEKATEIGVDEFSFLDCQFSERHVLKTDRVEKIVVSAAKQSHKAWMPQVNEMISFKKFVEQERNGQKFICHCYDQADIEGDNLSEEIADSGRLNISEALSVSHNKPHLKDLIDAESDCTVLIGPEGDFSVEEVRLAEKNGFISVSLGTSRLRTETAALVATHLMQLIKQF